MLIYPAVWPNNVNASPECMIVFWYLRFSLKLCLGLNVNDMRALYHICSGFEAHGGYLYCCLFDACEIAEQSMLFLLSVRRLIDHLLYICT